MARKIEIEDKQPQEKVNSSTTFEADFNQEEGVVSFKLTDGTPIEMKSPKARQLLLLESYIKNAPKEERTDSFVAMKFASLIITKFGDKDKISFDELLDNLETIDMKRVAAAIALFRDFFECLQ